jgi:uncharacterized YigZ family protein
MDEALYMPLGMAETEIIEKRSRFIGKAEGITTPEEARSAVGLRKVEHHSSSHVVHAFLVGPPNSRTMGMSDDGEPKGTAGKPVLEVLKGSGIINILVTIVRYFGGTKLGTGGLVRAYAQTARETLSRLNTVQFETRTSFTITVPYDLYNPIIRIIKHHEGQIVGEVFDTHIGITGEIRENMIQLLQTDIQDLSKGSLTIQLITE